MSFGVPDVGVQRAKNFNIEKESDTRPILMSNALCFAGKWASRRRERTVGKHG